MHPATRRRRGALAAALAAAVVCLVAAGRAAEKPSAGLAARYPADKGIDRDPAVLLHEDFEDAEKVFDRKRWSAVSNKNAALKLVTAPADVHGGKQALQITATLGRNTGGHLFRRFADGQEKMHARFCVKFAADCDYIHHFVTMVAELPATPWPTGGAGLRPAGDRKFSIGIEPWGQWGKYPPPGGWHFYNYWWKMPRSRDGKFWGQGPDKDAYAVPQRGKWYCVEFLAACNTPGKPDGQLALWIDGKKLIHHKDINWRSDEKLKLNAFWLMLYVTDRWTKHPANTVWFDDIVVATDYIGPPVRASVGGGARGKPRR